MQCPVSDYAAGMPKVQRTTQHTVGVDDELWADCKAIAAIRRERVSQVIRRKLVEYRNEHRDLLDEVSRSVNADGD